MAGVELDVAQSDEPPTSSRDAEKAEHDKMTVSFLSQKLDARCTFWIMTLYCLCSGWIGAVGFAATYIWLGFQSGNLTQIGMAVAEAMTYRPSFERRPLTINDRQAIASFFTFALAGHLPRVIAPLGPSRRRTLALSTLIQALMTGFAALATFLGNDGAFAIARDQPQWTNTWGWTALVVLTAAQGIQGTSAEALHTPFGATTVATSLFSQLGAMPLQEFIALHKSRARDAKCLGLFAIALGGLCGRALTASIGPPLALFIAAIVKALTAGLCLLVPATRP